MYISRKFLDADHTPLTENYLLATKSILNFLTLIWRSGTEGGIHHHTLSCFLTPLVNWLSNEPRECTSTHIVLDSLLTSMAALEGLRSGLTSTDANKFRLWDDEAIWQLAINSSRSNLVVACQSSITKYLVVAFLTLHFAANSRFCKPHPRDAGKSFVRRALSCGGMGLSERCYAAHHIASLPRRRRTTWIDRLSSNLWCASAAAATCGYEGW
jgi:hypothetical protein